MMGGPNDGAGPAQGIASSSVTKPTKYGMPFLANYGPLLGVRLIRPCHDLVLAVCPPLYGCVLCTGCSWNGWPVFGLELLLGGGRLPYPVLDRLRPPTMLPFRYQSTSNTSLGSRNESGTRHRTNGRPALVAHGDDPSRFASQGGKAGGVFRPRCRLSCRRWNPVPGLPVFVCVLGAASVRPFHPPLRGL